MAHPPRSNPPLRSSSGPPRPCITPSTETFVVVVSFMVAGPFSLVWSSFGTTGPPHRSHRSWHGPCCSSCCAFSEHGPHVGDVLLNRHREHRRALFLIRAAAAEGLAGRLRLPALEDVDAAPGRADRRRSRNRDSQLPRQACSAMLTQPVRVSGGGYKIGGIRQAGEARAGRGY